MPKPGRLIVAVAAALLTLGAARASAAEVFPSVSPSVLRGPAPWLVDYAIEFDAGPADEHIEFSIRAGRTVPPDPRLDGPGTLTSTGWQLVGGGASCESGFGDIDFGVGGGSSWALDLPAGQRTIVRVTAPVTRRFALDERRFEDIHFSVDGNELPIPGPELAVSRAVPVALSARLPARTRYSRVGEAVPLEGRTSPQLNGQAVDLRAAYAGSARWMAKPAFNTPVARVRVKADGSFAYAKWSPPQAGHWAISAFYNSHDARFLDSTLESCFPGVWVGRPPPG